MAEGRDDAAQFGKALQAADRRVARLRLALQVVENVLAMVRSEGNVVV